MTQGIITEDLTKIYRSWTRKSLLRSIRTDKIAVDNLNIAVPPGQVTGLLGLNGAGKTTTIKVLSTLLLPTSGRVLVDGLDVTRDARAIRRRINMITGGERMVYWRLTGRENLWYFAQLYDVPAQGLQSRIEELLRLVGLEGSADITVERYSKGMKQRLQIARGLINDPTYLFLDEPTLGLDAPIARDLRNLVRQMADQGRGILLTSHYLQEVEELCSQVYVIDHGRLIAAGSPAELKALTDRKRTVRVHLAELPPAVADAVRDVTEEMGATLETVTGDEGTILTVRHQADLTGRIAAAVALNGGSMIKLEALEPTLEDAMFELMAQTQSSTQQQEGVPQSVNSTVR